MIQMIRIDDRLLHGQIAYSWRAKLDYDAVVIVSEAAAKDDMRKATLKLCCPEGVKLATRGIDKAIELLKNDQLKNMKVLVVCPDPETVQAVLKKIDERPKVNVGGIQKHDNSTMFAQSVYLSQEEIDVLDRLTDDGYDVEVQMVPETSMHKYKDLRKGQKG